MSNNKYVIFDLDGTLADIESRKNKATVNGKINWNEFFNPEYIKLDVPITPVIETYKVLRNAGYNMFIMTGRDARTKEETKKWLADNGIIPDYLIMRKQGDRSDDTVLKKQWLQQLYDSGVPKENILCVYDDRDKVVKMWREQGLMCFQTAPGDF